MVDRRPQATAYALNPPPVLLLPLISAKVSH